MYRWLSYVGVSSLWKYVLKNRIGVFNTGLSLDGLMLQSLTRMIGQVLKPLFLELWIYNSYWIDSMYVKGA